MPATRDDDDWVGTPPEGRISRDRAKPGAWGNDWQSVVARAILPLLVIVAIVLILVLK